VAALAKPLYGIQPDLVITYGANGECGQPQRSYTHRAVLLAVHI
jgi:hypothetical protein